MVGTLHGPGFANFEGGLPGRRREVEQPVDRGLPGFLVKARRVEKYERDGVRVVGVGLERWQPIAFGGDVERVVWLGLEGDRELEHGAARVGPTRDPNSTASSRTEYDFYSRKFIQKWR